MKFDDFRLLINKYSSLMCEVNLSLHGESLLHPQIETFVKYLNQQKIEYVLITNGSLLSKKHSRILKKYPPKSIIFSLYTIDEDKYNKLTGGNLKNVLNNIDYFLKIKNSKTKVSIRTINIPFLESDREEFIQYFNNKNISFDLNVLNSWAGRVDIKKIDKNTKKHISVNKYCIEPWTRILIGCDLGVYACCNQCENPLGNLRENSLEEIWNSEKYQTIRKNILKGDYKANAMCKQCDYFSITSNVPKPSYLFFLKKDFLKRILYSLKLKKIPDLMKIKKE